MKRSKVKKERLDIFEGPTMIIIGKIYTMFMKECLKTTKAKTKLN